MKNLQIVAVILASSMFLSSPAMAFNGDLFSGKGLTSSTVQNVAWKFSWENCWNNIMAIVRPDNRNSARPAQAGPPENPGNSNSTPAVTATSASASSTGSSSGGAAHAVPEMDAAGGIIAFSLMLSLFGFFREKRRQLLLK